MQLEPHYRKPISDLVNSSKKKDIEKKRSLKKAIDAVLSGNIKGKGHLHGNLRGKRYRYAPNDHRLLYALCKECKELSHEKYNCCPDCDNIASDNKVVFFYFSARKEDYKL